MATNATDAVLLASLALCIGAVGSARRHPEGVLMADRHIDTTRRKPSVLPGALWIASGAIVLVGFILRPLGSYFGREFRYTGIAVIALGLAVAIIAWFTERWSQGRDRD
jgi:hypothetical protein